MALLKIREINSTTYLGFWKITEVPETLQELLHTITRNQLTIPAFASAARQRQWLSSRVLAYTLLQRFTNAFIPLQSNNNGKPVFVNDSYHISITHSQQMVAVLLSEHCKVGIDIEIISPKVLRVADKFMNPAERTDAAGDLEKTLIYWSAKETLYKLYSKKQLIFKEHIIIEPFGLKQPGTLTTRIKTPDSEETYLVNYEKLNDYILTYCVA